MVMLKVGSFHTYYLANNHVSPSCELLENNREIIPVDDVAIAGSSAGNPSGIVMGCEPMKLMMIITIFFDKNSHWITSIKVQCM
jgi:hypothetical protein